MPRKIINSDRKFLAILQIVRDEFQDNYFDDK